jgi:hypothetical protein
MDGSSPMTDIIIRSRNLDTERQRHSGKLLSEHGGRKQDNVSISQRAPRTAGKTRS